MFFHYAFMKLITARVRSTMGGDVFTGVCLFRGGEGRGGEGRGGGTLSWFWVALPLPSLTRTGVPSFLLLLARTAVPLPSRHPLPRPWPGRLCGAGGTPLALTQEDFLVKMYKIFVLNRFTCSECPN